MGANWVDHCGRCSGRRNGGNWRCLVIGGLGNLLQKAVAHRLGFSGLSRDSSNRAVPFGKPRVAAGRSGLDAVLRFLGKG